MSATQTPYPEKCRLPFLLYPPAMWQNPLGEAFVHQYLGMDEPESDYVIYLSIPFCRVQCKACPYFVTLLSEGDRSGREDQYVDALVRDIRRWGLYPRWAKGSLRSVYLGGGTGSILRTDNLRRVVDAVTTSFPCADDFSLTLEGNARDFTTEKLDYVAHSPITRVSLGVQSFDPNVLEVVGSPHAAEASIEVIRGLHARGFHNIQMDLMYNMPLHTMDVWRRDLVTLAELDIRHFTIYLYRVHPETPQYRLIMGGRIPAPHDPDSAAVVEMRNEAIRFAEQLGYRQYMFDHFAKEGHESEYNRWTFREAADALGIGAGAYSFINGYRAGTPKDVRGYIDAVARGEHLVDAVSERMTPRVRRERYVIFAFQYWEIRFEAYTAKFGTSFLDEFAPQVSRLLEKGLVEVLPDRIVMTQLGKEWRMNVLLEFVNEAFWGDSAALTQPNWAMNIAMVDLVSHDRSRWLGAL